MAVSRAQAKQHPRDFRQTKTPVVITEVKKLMVAGAGLEPATSWL
jgi:hypothetical protein